MEDQGKFPEADLALTVFYLLEGLFYFFFFFWLLFSLFALFCFGNSDMRMQCAGGLESSLALVYFLFLNFFFLEYG